jgi:transcriptional regulator with GAF, ATPase, and Fis domain
VGELSLPLQAQLLRVVQERQYKRVGSNSWQDSDFRLVCATHRDLETAVAEGRFRADLYHRIAGWHCSVPPLRERRQDVLPLARHFLRECADSAADLPIDPVVRDFLLTRDYPGNVRELRQLVQRLWHRHSGPGPLTVGDVPEQERPRGAAPAWPDSGFEAAIRQAVERGVGLNEIGQRAKDTAVRVALECEAYNVQRAAARLRVSDRLLQIRKKERQQGAVARAPAPPARPS